MGLLRIRDLGDETQFLRRNGCGPVAKPVTMAAASKGRQGIVF